MEDLWDKIGGVVAAVITAFGGFYMYDRKTTNERITKVELDIAQSKSDIRVIETKFDELKEDTKEIKESQKAIIELLTTLPNRRSK